LSAQEFIHKTSVDKDKERLFYSVTLVNDNGLESPMAKPVSIIFKKTPSILKEDIEKEKKETLLVVNNIQADQRKTTVGKFPLFSSMNQKQLILFGIILVVFISLFVILVLARKK